jgi:uncharacterized membrane protein
MDEQDTTQPASAQPTPGKNRRSAAAQFFLRGLAIGLPPVLTLVILIWIAQGLNDYIINPISETVRYTIALGMNDSRPVDELVKWRTPDRRPSLPYGGTNYIVTEELAGRLEPLKNGEDPKDPTDGLPTDSQALEKNSRTLLLHSTDEVYIPLGTKAVPYEDYVKVAESVGANAVPSSATGVYMELVTIRYFGQLFSLSIVSILVTVALIYFLGRIVTARLGAWSVNKVETLVLGRLPVISNVYSSVKQVTDFLFTERTIEYNRVVAVEYPRRDMWSLGFVTSDSMLEITVAAGEPLVAVLMPTSPMPMTGFTVSVPRREVVDLNITIDQAFQFCLSCGVLVPSGQRVTPEVLQEEFAKRIAERMLPGVSGTAAPRNDAAAPSGATDQRQGLTGPESPAEPVKPADPGDSP